MYYYYHKLVQNVEEWECEKTEADMETYVWDMTGSKPAIINTVKKMQEMAQQVQRD